MVLTANTLRDHFLKKRYVEDKLIANGKLSDIRTLVFRGKDQKNRMIVVVLTTPGQQEGETFEEAMKNISLQLSYISNPGNPDILSVEVKEGEF